jgi:hypothetical protein
MSSIDFGSMRLRLRSNILVQRVMALTKRISCFGLVSNKKKSIQGSLFEMFCFLMAFGSFILTAVMVYFGLFQFDYMSNWATTQQAFQELDMNWWEYLNILLLIVGIFWPAYIRERDARIQFARQGTFSSRIVISLNCCAMTDDMSAAEQRDNIPNLFYMRTLTEEGISTFFPDEFVQMIIDKSKKLRMRHGRAQFEIHTREKVEQAERLAKEQEQQQAAVAVLSPTSESGGARGVTADSFVVPMNLHDPVGETAFSSGGSKADEGVRQVAHLNSIAAVARVKMDASQSAERARGRLPTAADKVKKFVETRRKKLDVDFLELESDKRDVIKSLKLKPLTAKRPGLKAEDYGGLDELFFFDPIMTVPYSHRKRFPGMLDHVRNNISKLSTPGHLRMDANLPSVSEEYIFAGEWITVVVLCWNGFVLSLLVVSEWPTVVVLCWNVFV